MLASLSQLTKQQIIHRCKSRLQSTINMTNWQVWNSRGLSRSKIVFLDRRGETENTKKSQGRSRDFRALIFRVQLKFFLVVFVNYFLVVSSTPCGIDKRSRYVRRLSARQIQRFRTGRGRITTRQRDPRGGPGWIIHRRLCWSTEVAENWIRV